MKLKVKLAYDYKIDISTILFSVKKCLDKHEESIKQQLIEKIEGVSDTLFGKRGNTEYVAAKSPSELKSEISSLIRNFKSE